jgi:general secretion pathway protein A
VAQTLDWPETQPPDASLAQAFTALLRRWGVDYESERDGKACPHAERHGLRCLLQQGTLQQLRGLDRPAVVVLRDPRVGLVQAALLGIEVDQAALALADQTRTVPVSDLEGRWGGEYVVLWRPPAASSCPSGRNHSQRQEWSGNRSLVAVALQAGPGQNLPFRVPPGER